MPDMLVPLYALPDSSRYERRCRDAGVAVRRAEPWDRAAMREFVSRNFGELWALEADRAYCQTPISGFLALAGPRIVGFAVYECTRRGYFGPTGVLDGFRGKGVGATLLFACLRAMEQMGYAYAVIGGVGPADYYEKTCGALVIPGSETGVYASLYQTGRERQR